VPTYTKGRRLSSQNEAGRESDAFQALGRGFGVRSLPPQEVVERLAARGIVATVTPYTPTYARVGPSILNTPAEIRRAVRALRALR
jgi:selenocysteine lyase/cysteine desulfurase